MSALLRARVSSFLAGVALTGVFGVYQLRGDVAEAHKLLMEQVRPPHAGSATCRLLQSLAACSVLPSKVVARRCFTAEVRL